MGKEISEEARQRVIKLMAKNKAKYADAIRALQDKKEREGA